MKPYESTWMDDDLRMLREESQQMIAADAVAAIGSVGQPMCEGENPHQSGPRFGSSRVRMTRAGTPATIVRGGTALVTTAPAPTMASSPTSAMITALLPIHEPRPILTIRRSPA